MCERALQATVVQSPTLSLPPAPRVAVPRIGTGAAPSAGRKETWLEVGGLTRGRTTGWL